MEYHTVGTEYQKIDNVLLSIVKLIEEIFLATDQTEVVSVLELVGKFRISNCTRFPTKQQFPYNNNNNNNALCKFL